MTEDAVPPAQSQSEAPLTKSMSRRKTDIPPDGKHLRRAMMFGTWMILTGVILWQGLDISEHQERLRDANNRLFRIFHGAIKPVVMCDERGKIVEYNKAAEEMFGWSRAEAMGKEVSMMIPPAYRAKHKTEFDRAVKELRATEEDWRIVKTGLKGRGLNNQGDEFPIIFSTRGIRYGNTIEFLAFFQREPDSMTPEVKAGPLEIPKKLVP